MIDRAMQAAAATLAEGHRPTMPSGPDPKWRYFWRVGERPPAQGCSGEHEEEFAELNAAPVVPVSVGVPFSKYP